jgi:hypothetical protein
MMNAECRMQNEEKQTRIALRLCASAVNKNPVHRGDAETQRRRIQSAFNVAAVLLHSVVCKHYSALVPTEVLS